MNKTQLTLLAELLLVASDELGNNHCNDFPLLNTPENYQFVTEMIAASSDPDDEPNISSDGSLIYIMDWQLADYFRELVLAEAAE